MDHGPTTLPAGRTIKSTPQRAADTPNHLPLLDLKWTRDDSWLRDAGALLTSWPNPLTAVIFVHGWGGNAVETWDCFLQLARTSEKFRATDVIFFGYPSRGPTTEFSAAKFREFLKDFLLTPHSSVIKPTLGPQDHLLGRRSNYSQVLLIGHSMGAVVIRRAISDLSLEPELASSLATLRLLLFAPAHKGSDLPEMVASGLGLNYLPGASFVTKLLPRYLRSIEDLRIGSSALKRLEKEVISQIRQLRTERKPINHLVASVVHAQNDKVVSQEKFAEDLPLEPVSNKNHRSLCKPHENFQFPILRVEQELS